MMDRSFRPKLAMSKAQGNVIMQQIRAEKKIYQPKH